MSQWSKHWRSQAAMAGAHLAILAALGASGCGHRDPLASSVTNTGGGGSGATGSGGNGAGGTAATGAVDVCVDRPFHDKYSPGYTAEQDPQVKQYLTTMTPEQKYRQMYGLNVNYSEFYDIQRTEDDPDTGIRGYWFRDGPRGVNLEAPQIGRYMEGGNHATSFPVPVAQGASFDLDLVFQTGAAMGDETVAVKNTMLLGPCMNILRHPAWGRAQETFGEDTWHVGRIASAYAAGLQTYVAGCAKHYAANNIEEDRAFISSDMDEQTLREVYTRHFEMVVREGGVACVMAAYNMINGVKCTANTHLLKDILKDEWGYRGLVLTDWWASPGFQDLTLPAASRQSNARAMLEAGLDIEVPWALNYSELQNVVGAEGVSMDLVDAAVERILEQKFRFHSALMNGPYGLKEPTTTWNENTGSIEGNEAHLDLAEELAAGSMVLLKNTDSVLPLTAASGTIGVVGATANYQVASDGNQLLTVNFAEEIRTGDRGSSRTKPDPAKTVVPLAGIQAAAQAHGSTVVYGTSVADVASADTLVVIVGMTAQDEGEEYTGASDRTNFNLDGKRDDGTQIALIQAAVATGKPVVLVMTGGSVINIPDRDALKGIVMMWYPGQMGGKAVGELLFGDRNFSGKLPITWGEWDNWPTFNSGSATQMDYYVGYRYFEQNGITPIFPWGHGLSYTTFAYSDLSIPTCDAGVSKGAIVPVSFTVTNTGPVPGREVAFLFVSFPETKRRPTGTATSQVSHKELRGFEKTGLLGPGDSETVTIPLRVADLKYWDMDTAAWAVEPGHVQVRVGSSSADADLTLEGQITVQ